MPYTAAQLTQFYTTLSRGATLDAATTAAINAAGAQSTAGQITDAQALNVVLDSTQVRATTDVAVLSYAFFTGTAPTVAGIDYLVNNPGSGYNTAYYNGTNGGRPSMLGTGGFDVANRYYNAAMNLAGNPGSVGNAAFAAQYGSLTLAQTVATAYNAIIGFASVGQAAADAAIASITAAIPYFQTLAQQRTVAGGSVDIATKAIIAAYILEEGAKADVGTYSRALDQYNTSLALSGTAASGNLLNTYGAGGVGFNPAVGPLSDGQTFTGPAGDAGAITSAGVAANGLANINVGSNAVLTFTGDIAINNGQVALNVSNGATGSNDTVSLRFTGQTIATPFSVIAPGVETIRVSAETSGTPVAGTVLSLDIQDVALTSLTITGNESVAYSAPRYAFLDGTFSGGALQTVNAAGATAAANIDVSSAGAAGRIVTVTGSAGADTLQFKDFATITAGAGADTLVVYAPTSASTFSTVMDEQAGDILSFFGVRVTNFNAQAIVATSIAGGLDSAASAGPGTISYFTFGGDTYVVADAASSNTFQPGLDSFVRLVGMHNLSGSTLTAQGALVSGG